MKKLVARGNNQVIRELVFSGPYTKFRDGKRGHFQVIH
jgi:hypothetical protein